MTKSFAITFGIGLLAIIAVVSGVLYTQRGAHLDPKGAILKVRTHKLDENSSAMVVDFRLSNNSDYALAVRRIDLTVKLEDGRDEEGGPIAAEDLQTMFRYYPILGQAFNEPMKIRDQVPPHQTVDRMVGFQFTLAFTALDSRKQVSLRIEDVTGAVAQFSTR